MRSRILKTLVIAVTCTATIGLSACGSSGGTGNSKSAGSAKKIVNVGIMNAPSGFNALDSSDVAQNDMTQILFKPLVELDGDFKFQPSLADSIDTTDNKTFTVKLNKKAKWTDGKPVTADDTMFTLGLITNPKVASTIASKFNILKGLDDSGKNTSGQNSFEGAKKIDDHTIQLVTKDNVNKAIFEDMVGQYLKTVPQHALKDVPLDQMFKASFFQNPTVTDGQFKLVTYKKDQYVQMAANKDYFRGAPKLTQLNFKIMQGTELTVQLQSGEIDMNDPLIGTIPNDDIEKVKDMKNIDVIKEKASVNAQTLQMNVKTIPDAKVRRAISYAINRKQIIKNIIKGAAEEIIGVYPPSSQFFDKDIDYASYDPAKAKALLKEANWDSNKVLKFNVPIGNTGREQAANVIAQNLQDVGIKVQIQKYDFVTSLSLGKKHQFDLYIVGLQVDPVNPDVSAYIGTGQTLDLSGYSNPTVDALLQQGKTTVDSAKVTDIYNKVQEAYSNDAPSIGVYAPLGMGAVNKRVVGVTPKSVGMYVDIEKWDVK
ncbi:ABC transporter substrate-binding protein [Clostridium guangxiense]|uniref:ABC transporter substrate-binding protein n=1 Tax=Clostridium guangxiense TaxID=1662055 RepID=UPI001E5BCB25|nr:ABC transporter substrate-binding protein [Clostridium guangxiense]MCD2348300.1 ABC transporter substrate-binding protein [Clostridium guangxiense]